MKLTSAARLLLALVAVAVLAELEQRGVLGWLAELRGEPRR